MALVQPAQRRRPGIVGVGLRAHLGHGLRHVDGELVRWRVLAGMQAGATVVAKVGQVVDVGLAELQPARHGRKHRTESLAIAAGIADLHDPRHFGLFRAQDRAVPTHGLPGRRLGQRLRVADQVFKLLHELLHSIARGSQPPRPGSGDAAEGCPDGHAHSGGIALAQHIASHHLAGNEQVVAGAPAKAHGGGLVNLQAQVGEGDAGPQRIAEEGRGIDGSRPMCLGRLHALGAAVVQRGMVESARPAGWL